MNTKLILSTETLNLPYFPKLTGLKTTRVITKHFTNCALYLPQNKLALLTWLIYQSKSDNTVEYNTHLLRKFSAAIKEAGKLYGGSELNTSVQYIRKDFKWLIEQGYLFPNYEHNVYTINPMLTYRAEYLRAVEYEEIADVYNSIKGSAELNDNDFRDIKLIGMRMSELINTRIKKKRL